MGGGKHYVVITVFLPYLLELDLGPKMPNTTPLSLPLSLRPGYLVHSFMIHLVTQQIEYLLCAGPYGTPWGYRGEPGMVLDLIEFFTNYSVLLKTICFFALGFHETTLSMFPSISLPLIVSFTSSST